MEKWSSHGYFGIIGAKDIYLSSSDYCPKGDNSLVTHPSSANQITSHTPFSSFFQVRILGLWDFCGLQDEPNSYILTNSLNPKYLNLSWLTFIGRTCLLLFPCDY